MRLTRAVSSCLYQLKNVEHNATCSILFYTQSISKAVLLPCNDLNAKRVRAKLSSVTQNCKFTKNPALRCESEKRSSNSSAYRYAQTKILRQTISLHKLTWFILLSARHTEHGMGVVDMILLLPQFAKNQKNCRRLPPCGIPLHECENSLFWSR